MGRVLEHGLVYCCLLLAFVSRTTSVSQKPVIMCATQLSLVTQACIFLPVSRGHGHEGSEHHHHRESEGRHGLRRHRRREEDGESELGRRRHSRHHHHEHASYEEDCCRWLKEVESVCVCETLARLPKFLTKPRHNVTVTVGDDCEVTYACGGF